MQRVTRKDATKLFTVFSTVCEIFAAKQRNSATRLAKAEWSNYLASATVRKPLKTSAKTLS
jgi:hypothetical protein